MEELLETVLNPDEEEGSGQQAKEQPLDEKGLVDYMRQLSQEVFKDSDQASVPTSNFVKIIQSQIKNESLAQEIINLIKRIEKSQTISRTKLDDLIGVMEEVWHPVHF